MSEIEKNQLFGWVGAVAKVIASLVLILTTATTIVLAALSLGEEKLRDFSSNFVGAAENGVKLERLTEDVNKLVDSVTDLKGIISNVHPPRVARFDAVRSAVFSAAGVKGECEKGTECEARFLAARTREADGCDAPILRRLFTTDENGRPSAATALETESLQQILSVEQDDWRSIYFTPSPRADAGFSEIYMELDHKCPGGMVITRTPPLPFTLLEN